METKACSRCKQNLSVSEFGPDRRRKVDGLKSICRKCDREIHAQRYASPEIAEKIRERSRVDYHRVRRYRMRERPNNGLCMFCNSPNVPGKTRCQEHQEKNRVAQRIRTKKYVDETRDMVFKHYGEECACCGEKTRRFLTIDHINGGGNKHRREIHQGRKVGFIHPWLRQNNFPPGFQVLCYNCNCGRAFNGGVCPHKQISTALKAI